MGRHSAPKKNAFADVADLLGALRPSQPGRRSARREAETLTSTGILAKVNRRPVLSAIAVPVAASAAIATSAAVMTNNGAGEDDTAAFASKLAPEADVVSPKAPKDAEKSVKAGAVSLAEPVEENTDGSAGSGAASSNGSASGASGSGSSSDSKSSSAGAAAASGNVSGAKCSVSSSIESGLTPNAISAYRAVCAQFPQVKSYGGRRNDPGSDHHTGNAVDVMITGSTGDAISNYLIKNSSKLNIKYIIWEQRIWMPGRGWKQMENRGSATANHFDHVHISVK